MNPRIFGIALVGAFVMLNGMNLSRAAETPSPLFLWPGTAPGDKEGIGDEKDATRPADGRTGGRTVIRLTNVTRPSLTVFRAPADKDTGAAIVVCPGGAYHILAWDLEGTEICQWLNSIGVTGVLLKYRVPRREGLEKHTAPLQDAQRVLGLVRHHAGEWGINPQRIGVLGFSAGGHLAATLSNNWRERTYPVADAADRESCRPDFTVLIYPAYLTEPDGGDKLVPELSVSTNTPPAFLAMTEDDPIHVENALVYTLALKRAKVPVELHVYPTGGHGYGLRPNGQTVTTWPDRVADWMRSQGWLVRK